MLELKRMAIFREVARQGSFSAAAAELSYTQPAVSHQIARLEAEVGARLLERRARGLALTAAGAALLPHVDRILAGVADAEAELADIVGGAPPRVRMAAFATASGTFVAQAIGAFRRAHTRAELSLIEGEADEVLPLLRGQEVDLAVVFDSPAKPLVPDRGIRLQALLEEPLLLALPEDHPLARSERLALEQLANEPWIEGAAPHSPCSVILVDASAARSFHPTVAFSSGNYEVVCRLVAAGVGVALVPGLALGVRPPGVAVRRVLGREPSRRIWLASRRDALLPAAVREMRTLLTRTAAAVAGCMQIVDGPLASADCGTRPAVAASNRR